MPARVIYPTALLIACLLYALLPPDVYLLPDEVYLHARYARNIQQGAGLGFNPGERVLLTPAILPILAQTLETPPGRLLPLLLMAVSMAALIRLLITARIQWFFAIGISLLWLLGSWSGMGGSGWWLACLGLIALDGAQAQQHRLSIGVAGLMLLVHPIALIFLILLNRRGWLIVLLPAFIWWVFAYVYFGIEGLRGLTLYSQGTDGLPYIIILGALFLISESLRLPQAWLPLVILSLAHTLMVMLLNQHTDPTLVWLGLVMIGFTQKRSQQRWRYALKGALLLVVLMLLAGQPGHAPATPSLLAGSKGYYGNYETAFYLGDTVYELSGASDPHLNDLVASGDEVGVILATAPDLLLIDTLPEDRALTLLDYTRTGDHWQRQTPLGIWRPSQPTDLSFGTDIHLTQVTLDRVQLAPGAVMRVRLDWQFDKTPELPIYLTLNLLDFQGVGVGSIEQIFPIEKWLHQLATTYHVLPVHEDAPPGLYRVEVIVGYNAALVERQAVTTIKLPVDVIAFETPPRARFTGIDLMTVAINQSEQQLELDLTWQATASLPADYTVFIHLTAPDAVIPLAQMDRPPLEGRYPTSIWSPGEVIQERYLLDVTHVPAGEYVIRVGWYHPELGRLPTPEGDHVIVETITLR